MEDSPPPYETLLPKYNNELSQHIARNEYIGNSSNCSCIASFLVCLTPIVIIVIIYALK